MIVVFWLDKRDGPHCSAFKETELSEALKFTEELRKRRREGEPLSHICAQPEQSDMVGEAGVGEPLENYGWYKRRIDPSIKLGREV